VLNLFDAASSTGLRDSEVSVHSGVSQLQHLFSESSSAYHMYTHTVCTSTHPSIITQFPVLLPTIAFPLCVLSPIGLVQVFTT